MAVSWKVLEQGSADEYALMVVPESGKPEWLISFRMNGEMTVDQQRAIVRQIAALPELVKSLKATTENCRKIAQPVGAMHAFWDDIFDAEAAITKAEGR